MTPFSTTPRAALVVAHPGHELRLHGWLEEQRPMVYVLSDGSGHSETSRLPSTTRVLERTGAVPGAVFGRYTDRQIYTALTEQRVSTFLELADDLASNFKQQSWDVVVADAAEGYNPSHDVCRILVDAVLLRLGRSHTAYEFPLYGAPDACPASVHARAMVLKLDAAALARKMAAAHAYAELAGEVSSALERHGSLRFREEWLWPAISGRVGRAWDGKPFYEFYGERQCAAGKYRVVISRRKHLLPLATALHAWAARRPEVA